MAAFSELFRHEGTLARGRQSTRQNLFGEFKQTVLTLLGQTPERRRYHETVAELQALSDRDLADIGIARWQIRDVAWRNSQLET
jgi:uncharacterized protein YjiS (DUF1127 family)